MLEHTEVQTVPWARAILSNAMYLTIGMRVTFLAHMSKNVCGFGVEKGLQMVQTKS